MMKKLVYAWLPMLALLVAACQPYGGGETAGKLGDVTANTNQLVVGRKVEFSVPVTAPAQGDVLRKEIIWSANDNQVGFGQSVFGEENIRVVYLPQNAGEITVKVTISYVFAHVSANTPSIQTVTATGKFVVENADVHQFVWGDSKETIKQNLTHLTILGETASSVAFRTAYGQYDANNGYWNALLKSDLASEYSFSDNKLNQVVEMLVQNPAEATNFHRQLTHVYFYNHAGFVKLFDMGEAEAIWASTPTDEETATLAQLKENYGETSYEQRELIGKCIAEGKLQLKSSASAAYQNEVIFFNKKANDSEIVYFYLLICPKK